MTDSTRDAALIGRVADPRRTDTVELGPCACPGAVHGSDTAQVRSQIGDGELRAALNAGAFHSGRLYNGAEADAETIATFTKSWTLLDADGAPYPISFEIAQLLDEGTRVALLAAINLASGRSVMLNAAELHTAIASLEEGGEVEARALLGRFEILVARERVLPNPSSGRSRGGTPATASARPTGRSRR